MEKSKDVKDFIENICKDCINKNSDLCEIHRTVDNTLTCPFLTKYCQDT